MKDSLKDNVEQFSKDFQVSKELAEKYLKEVQSFEGTEFVHFSELLKTEKPKSVLELGAGSGAFTKIILEKYLSPADKLFALERREEDVKKLRADIADSRLTILDADITKIPLQDKRIDVVVSRAIMHEFLTNDGDVIKALQDTVRVLKPAGVYMVYDKVSDGFKDATTDSVDGYIEMALHGISKLENLQCWGIHSSRDFYDLFSKLGLSVYGQVVLKRPIHPNFRLHLEKLLAILKPQILAKFGTAGENIFNDIEKNGSKYPPVPLPLCLTWGKRHS